MFKKEIKKGAEHLNCPLKFYRGKRGRKTALPTNIILLDVKWVKFERDSRSIEGELFEGRN
jgi:hypothetical protein